MSENGHKKSDHDMLISLYTAVCEEGGLVDRVGKQNGRISKLEQRFWMLAGGILVAVFILDKVMS